MAIYLLIIEVTMKHDEEINQYKDIQRVAINENHELQLK